MAKSTSRRAVQSAIKVKTAVTLTPECFKRLGACCLSEGLSQSEVVERLINERLAGYIVAVRGSRLVDSRVNLTDRLDQVAEINPAA
jgi:hypothetical protein